MPTAAKRFKQGGGKWNSFAPCRQYHRMYCGATWQKLRDSFLRDNPMCVECLKAGVYKLAKVVDHVVPHRGDKDKFFQLGNLQSLCEIHHNQKTYQEGRNG